MKRAVIGTMGPMILLFLGARTLPAQERTFTGLISDEHLNCIQNPMKVPAAEKGVPPWGKTACMLYYAHSVKPESKYVLYDADSKTTYQLDDQAKVEPWVGDTEKVAIAGTLDESTKTIHVKDIKSGRTD